MSTTCLTSNCSDYMSGSLGLIFTSALQFLFAAQCGIRDKYPPDASDTIETMDMNFDYIVVGAGSAGSVVAARLSEDPCIKLLLLEAGGNPPFESEVPGGFSFLPGSEYDWKFETENDTRSCQASGGKCRIIAGKMLGGTSSINGMDYSRGNRRDYDDLQSAGNKGWDYNEALKYFKKSENMSSNYIKNDPKLSPYHNFSGPLGVEVYDQTTPVERTIIRAYEEFGLPYNPDPNGPHQDGVFRSENTIQNGRRSSTAAAFLAPANSRKNLVVLKFALATKILIQNKAANGVRIKLKNGTVIEAFAKKEIIVCAGAIKTPQLLMLSGIGPCEHLKEFNISCVMNLSVGQNLIDHWNVPIVTTIRRKITQEDPTKPVLDIIEYITSSTGPYSNVLFEGINIQSFINANKNVSSYNEVPNFQIFHLAFPAGAAVTNASESCSLGDANFNFLVSLLDGKSRGNVSLFSNNPEDNPKIYENFFSDDRDIEDILRAIDFITRIVEMPSFKAIGMKIKRVSNPACDAFIFPSVEYWKCIAYQFGVSGYHLRGTAKMGPPSDANAVVDHNLKVYGVKNLRVVDGSVIPGPIRGNINAPIIMFAERASDLIKATHKNDPCCP